MYKNKRILCIIPARGGSKGVPGKNIKLLCGKPLIAYTISHARKSRYIDRVMVSTDSLTIAAVARRYGAEVPFIRPASLAKDNSGTIEVLLHAVKTLEEDGKQSYDIIVLLHATTPLRSPADIDNCIELLVRTHAGSVFSVTPSHRNPYFNMVEMSKGGKARLVKTGRFATRQDAPPVYDMNSSIYAWPKNVLLEKRKTILDNSRIYVMPKARSVDIDDPLDFVTAETFFRKKLHDKKY